jgi:hypothetical protein
MQQMEDIAADEDAMEALKDLEDELQDCKDGMNQCEGEGEEFKDKRNQNDFAKGSGRGHGKRDFEENDTGTYKSRVAAKLQKGQTIVTGDADGENATTGSIAEAREAVEASLKREADPMEDQQLPRAQREHAKQYFEKFRTGGK